MNRVAEAVRRRPWLPHLVAAVVAAAAVVERLEAGQPRQASLYGFAVFMLIVAAVVAAVRGGRS